MLAIKLKPYVFVYSYYESDTELPNFEPPEIPGVPCCGMKAIDELKEFTIGYTPESWADLGYDQYVKNLDDDQLFYDTKNLSYYATNNLFYRINFTPIADNGVEFIDPIPELERNLKGVRYNRMVLDYTKIVFYPYTDKGAMAGLPDIWNMRFQNKFNPNNWRLANNGIIIELFRNQSRPLNDGISIRFFKSGAAYPSSFRFFCAFGDYKEISSSSEKSLPQYIFMIVGGCDGDSLPNKNGGSIIYDSVDYDAIVSPRKSIMQEFFIWLNNNGVYFIKDGDKPGMPDTERNDDILIPDEWGKSPAFDMGFISAYVPTHEQLQQLSYKMHSKDFWTALANLFNNLDDGVISLGLLPFQVPTRAMQELKFAWVSTGVSMPLAAKQNIKLNLGTVVVPTIYHNFLDYSPNTKAKIFLPFLGERDLSVDDIIGKNINLFYNVDVLTGDFVAHMSVEGNDLYHWTGNCMMHLPISSRSFQSLFNSYVSMVSSIGRGVIATTIPASGSKAYQIASKNAENAMGAIESIGNYIVNSKPTLSHNGDASGSSGYLDVLTPYIYIERPNYQEPDDYDALYGKPSNSTVTLSQLTGFVKVSQIHLVGISATDTELDEIVRLLKEGVIL